MPRWYIFTPRAESRGGPGTKRVFDWHVRTSTIGDDEDPQATLNDWQDLSDEPMLAVYGEHTGTGAVTAERVIRPTGYRLYGLSLSLCVMEILAGKRTVDEIDGIIAATRFDSWREAVLRYERTYWSKYNGAEIDAVMAALWPKVVQPRLLGFESHNISRGSWLHVSPSGEPVMVEMDDYGTKT